MNLRGPFSRRHLINLGAALAPAARYVALARQDSTTVAPWSPADGLRLAGAVQGIASLDPALSRDVPTNFVVRQVCRGLVGYDADLNPVPELAGSIDVAGDGLAYTFTLRADARFHDGRPIEAADVAYSFTRALTPATAGGASALAGVTYLRDIAGAGDVLAGRASTLAGVEVLDDRRVRIRLDEPSATFLMKLAAVPASILDRHQATTDPAWWTRINGSGPFRVATVDPNTLIELRPVDAWHSAPIALAGVSIRLGLSANLPVNLFQAGEIDIVPDVLPQLVPLLRDPASGDGSGTLTETPLFALAYIALGNQRPPLDDVHIRRALQRAFPARLIAEATLSGQVLAPVGVIPPGMLGAEWPASMPAPDVDAARAEIAASRYGTPERVPPIRIAVADRQQAVSLRDVGERDLGLTIEVVQANWRDFLDGLAARRWDAYSIYWSVDYPDPEALLWMLFGSDSAENYTGYSNPAFDAQLAEARRRLRAEDRRKPYARAQQMLIDDAAVIPLYVSIGYTLARAGITELPVTPMGLLGLETIA
ncbi:MAG TPA: peptide ABC transporter substrate-binding protein [Thermomicrobiales bacterium]|nr:peptide ABC transporter substrate-binding protein [Thermomicrobiales bacterium]